jgi:DNA-binding response OmpR family regulator
LKKTEIAEGNSEFLNKIDTFDPDLVTLDVMMLGLTTSEILKKNSTEKEANQRYYS